MPHHETQLLTSFIIIFLSSTKVLMGPFGISEHTLFKEAWDGYLSLLNSLLSDLQIWPEISSLAVQCSSL